MIYCLLTQTKFLQTSSQALKTCVLLHTTLLRIQRRLRFCHLHILLRLMATFISIQLCLIQYLSWILLLSQSEVLLMNSDLDSLKFLRPSAVLKKQLWAKTLILTVLPMTLHLCTHMLILMTQQRFIMKSYLHMTYLWLKFNRVLQVKLLFVLILSVVYISINLT